MSQENLAVVRASLEVLRTGNAERRAALIRDLVHPDFELHPLYLDRVYVGAPGVEEFVHDLSEAWEDYVLELQELIDLDDRVVAVMRMSARGRGSNVPVVQEIATVSTFVDQKVIHVKAFASRPEALEAVGLPE